MMFIESMAFSLLSLLAVRKPSNLAVTPFKRISLNRCCVKIPATASSFPTLFSPSQQPQISTLPLKFAHTSTSRLFSATTNLIQETRTFSSETEVLVEEPQAEEMFPNFQDLTELHPGLKKNVVTMNYTHMTEIQAKTWEAASSGRDVLGRARTGTGKTVAFLLPAIQQLLGQTRDLAPDTIHMLVLSPTRELAAQIDDQAQKLGAGTGITHQVVFGGASKPKDIKSFERRAPTILVATPGRLLDHLQTTTIRGKPFAKFLSKTSILVLDETDRLLDMGFRREVEDIISYLPAKNQRQTLLFSATVPPEVKAVMGATMKTDFVTVDCIHDTDPASHTNAQVEQTHVIMSAGTRLVTGTVDILYKLIHDTKAAGEPLKLVVFFNTAHLVAFYAALFNEGLGVRVLELHSRKSQSFRTKTADTFRAADEAILFTSDVSARGVDYPGVTDVVQFGIPDSRESYIHRLGRTGRAGKVGEGLLVLTDLEKKFLSQLGGLDVAKNEAMQNLIDGPPSPSMMHKLDPILTSISNENNESLSQNAKAAYRSMLGFYNGKLAKLGVPGTDRLVEFVNGFASQAGLKDLPELEMKTVKKMGLTGAKGLNIVKNASVPGRHQGGGGGDRGAFANTRNLSGDRVASEGNSRLKIGGGSGGRGGGGGNRGSLASNSNSNGDREAHSGTSKVQSGDGRGGRGGGSRQEQQAPRSGGRGGTAGRRTGNIDERNTGSPQMKRHMSSSVAGAPSANFTKKPKQESSESRDASGAGQTNPNRRRRNGRGNGANASGS